MSILDIFRSKESRFLESILHNLRECGGIPSLHIDHAMQVRRDALVSAGKNIYFMPPKQSGASNGAAQIAVYRYSSPTLQSTCEVWGDSEQIKIIFLHHELTGAEQKAQVELTLMESVHPIEIAQPRSEDRVITTEFASFQSNYSALERSTVDRILQDTKTHFPTDLLELFYQSSEATNDLIEIYGPTWFRPAMIDKHLGWAVGEAGDAQLLVAKSGTEAPELYLVDHEECSSLYLGSTLAACLEKLKAGAHVSES